MAKILSKDYLYLCDCLMQYLISTPDIIQFKA